MVKSIEPKVSIIIPVYNGSNYLKEAIESALGQTYKNIEVIVIDDGSNDNGKIKAIIDSYKGRIKSYYQSNQGVAAALNLGIDMMEGEYFSWLSHDDLYLPQKIENQMKILLQPGNENAIIYSGYDVINEQGTKILEYRPDKSYDLSKYNHPLFPVMRLLVNGCTVLFHKRHFARIGGFNVNLPTTQDYDLWYRLFRGQKVIYSSHIDVINRSHAAQGSRAHIEEHVKECERLWLYMLSHLTKEEIATIDDSAYMFFKKTQEVLKAKTLYYKTIEYLGLRALRELNLTDINAYKMQETRLLQVLEGDAVLCNTLREAKVMQKNKPRIAFFGLNPNTIGGLTKIVNLVAKGLAESYEIIMVYSNWEIPGGFQKIGNIIAIKMQLGNMWQEKLRKLYVLLGVDIFVGTLNCLDYTMKLYESFRAYGIKCIGWNHEDYYFTEIQKQYQGIGHRRKAIFHNLEAVVWINKQSKLKYKQEAGNGVYIPNYLAGTNLVSQFPNKEPYSLIAVGRFQDEIKRIDRLIEVFALLYARNPNYKLYIVGMYNPEIKEKITKLAIPEDKIIFTGWVSNVPEYYKRCKVQLVTSNREGFGLVVLESALYGVPTVAFSNGGVDTIIEDGKNGYIAREEAEMVTKIEVLINNELLYKNMQEECKKLRETFSQERIIQKWKQLIDGILYEDKTKLLALFNEKVDGKEE